MEHKEYTLEELLAQTQTARRNAFIIHNVLSSLTAQNAEDAVAEEEFPTNTLREVRLLWHLHQKHPEVFAKTVADFVSATDVTSAYKEPRVFSVNYGSKFSDSPDSSGSLLVKPHLTLPPALWDYTLIDEDGDVVYSPQGLNPKYDDRVECVLTHGSRSLPASLRIYFERDVYGTRIEFVVVRKDVGSYPADTKTFTWIRHIPRPTETNSGEYEWITRKLHSSQHGDDNNRALFRPLTAEEHQVFESGSYIDPKRTHWALILETLVPTDKLLFSAKTIYVLDRMEKLCDGNSRNPARKVERARMSSRDPETTHYAFSPFVSHTGIRTMPQQPKSRHNSLDEAVADIDAHTPEYIDGLGALWKYFGFKRPDGLFFYNMHSNAEIEKDGENIPGMLPVWKK